MIDVMNVRCPHCNYAFDVDIYVGEEVSGCNASLVKKTVQRVNWKEIRNEIKNGNGNAILSVEDQVNFLLKDGRKASVSVAAMNPYAPNTVAFAFDDLLWNAAMNEVNTNSGGWARSDIAAIMENKILPLMPDELADAIAERKIIQKISGQTFELTSKLWLPSFTEVFGENDRYKDVDFGDVYFPLFNTEKHRVKANEKGETDWYWLRSPYVDGSTFFWVVNLYGNSYYYAASIANGVCPCFII